MDFNLRKIEDARSVQFEFEARGSYWERLIATRAIIAAYQGRYAYNGAVEAYLIGGNQAFVLQDDGKSLRTRFCWNVGGGRQGRDQYVELVEPAILGLKNVVEAAVAVNALAIEVFGTALSDLEAHYRGLSTIAAAAADRAEGMQRQLDEHRDGLIEAAAERLSHLEDHHGLSHATHTYGVAPATDGAAYPATFKPTPKKGGFLRRFGAFFGVTRPPQCDACGSDQDVRGGFCVPCRAETAGERVGYGAAS